MLNAKIPLASHGFQAASAGKPVQPQVLSETMKIIREEIEDPMWDTVGLLSCDFRPVFDGNFHNLFTCVSPGTTPETTQAAMEQHAREIAQWVLDHRSEFGTGDRFQIVVGWPSSVRQSGRQTIKTGGDFEAISAIAGGTAAITPRPGWTNQVFENKDPEPQG